MTENPRKKNFTPYIKRLKTRILKNPNFPLNLFAFLFLSLLFLTSLIPDFASLEFFLKTRNTFLISGGLAIPLTMFFYILALFPRVNLLPFWAGLSPILLALVLLAWGYPFLPALALGSIGFAGLEIYPRISRFIEGANRHPSFFTSKVMGISDPVLFLKITLPVSISILGRSFLRVFLCILAVETTISFLGLKSPLLETWGTALNQAYLHPDWPQNWGEFLWPGAIFLLTSLACSILIEEGKNNVD